MNDQPILTDATLEAMLARRAGPGAPDGLIASIAAGLDALPKPRRPWWSVLAPPPRQNPALRLAWLVAIMGLLLAATVSVVFVGSQLLRRTSELAEVVPPAVLLTLAPGGEVTAVAWSPDGSRLATGSSVAEGDLDSDTLIGHATWTRDTIRVWDAGTGEEMLVHEELDSPVNRIAYSPDGSLLATGSSVLDATTGQVQREFPDRFLAFSPDGSRAAAGGAWGAAGIIDATTGEFQLAFPLAPRWMWDATWSPDGRRLATVWGSNIKIWDAASGAQQMMLVPSYFATDLEWSPDGTRIAAAGDEAWAPGIWDATTGDMLVRLKGHSSGVTAIEWSPDGTRIASAGRDGTAKIWDPASGVELLTLGGHTHPLNDVAWSPDGTRIAIASGDGTATIWRLPMAVEVQPSAPPSPTVAPTALPPLVLQPVGESTVSESVLGTITWQAYEEPEGHWLGGLTGTPHGPVALDGNDLRWLGPAGTWEGLALAEEASPLISVGDELLTGAGLPRRLSWDGSRWVVGADFDLPPYFTPLGQVATGPHGTIVACGGNLAIARDGQHFVAASRPPTLVGPGAPLVLATSDGFVALVSARRENSGGDPLFEPVPWFSDDGLAWEQASPASPFGEGAWIRSVAGWGRRFVAVGVLGSYFGPWAAWVSDDGRAWERLPDIGLERAERCSATGEGMLNCMIGVTAGSTGWVIYTGWAGSVSASTDGRTWESLPELGVSGRWLEVALGGDKIVGVGINGVVVGTIERPGSEGR